MTKMKKISVEELKPGMVYNEALYVDSSNLIVKAHDAIKESDIKKLMTWGVTEIETTGMLIKTGENDDLNLSTSANEKKILANYHDLLSKRKKLISINQQSRNAVKKVHTSIKTDENLSTDELEKAVEDIINLLNDNRNAFLFLYGLEEGKDYLVAHSVNVTFYAIIIGIALNYSLDKLKELGLGTILIDAGMKFIPPHWDRKQNLTKQEIDTIKTHPVLGFQALRKLSKLSDQIVNVSFQHHEQFDGNGYPRGLKGDEISEFARIAAIADSYEAQISNRSYKVKVDFYHAMRNLLSSGVNKYDPVILKVFLSRMSVYPIGSLVEINDSRIGIIIGSIPEKPLRPIIKVIFDENGKRIEDTIILNLLEETSHYILKALDEQDVGINIFDVL